MNIILPIVTAVSLLVAVVMSVVAWRIVRVERRRSEARIAALAREIQGAAPNSTGSLRLPEPVDEYPLTRPESVASPGEMFAARSSRSRLPLAATVVILILGTAGVATILFEGRPEPVAAEVAVTPLELVALGHERDPDGVTVRGVLRNPLQGAELSHLTAVVLLFDRNGRYVASGRAAVQAPTLEPGGETTFVVTVSGAPDVERYRVSFRTENDVAVPHVDHRS
jgi:hypothetical protein